MPRRFRLRALREAREEVARDRDGAFLVVQQLSKEADLVEKTVLVQRVLPLRDLVLFERLLRLAEESETISQIGSHIGIVGSGGDGLLVMLDRVRPVLPIVIPVRQRPGRINWCEWRNIRRDRGGRRRELRHPGRLTTRRREKAFDLRLGGRTGRSAHRQPCRSDAKTKSGEDEERDRQLQSPCRRFRRSASLCHHAELLGAVRKEIKFFAEAPTRAPCAIFRPVMSVFSNIAAYKFAPLTDLEALQAELREMCGEAEVRGTILLSPEGINLFVSAERPAVDRLLVRLRSIPDLAELRVKVSESDQQPFNRMLVKIKKEIIAFGVEGIDPARRPAPRVTPRELKQWLDEGRPVTLLDARNTYEIKLGTFRGARTLDLDHFREFPAAAASLPNEFKNEPVVTFCTGGIRCEKAAPLLEMAGFTKVFQLDGGILNYFKECGGEHYEGDCFVFDKRVALDASLCETGAALCFVCQMPLTLAEQQDTRYVPSISCPHCRD